MAGSANDDVSRFKNIFDWQQRCVKLFTFAESGLGTKPCSGKPSTQIPSEKVSGGLVDIYICICVYIQCICLHKVSICLYELYVFPLNFHVKAEDWPTLLRWVHRPVV